VECGYLSPECLSKFASRLCFGTILGRLVRMLFLWLCWHLSFSNLSIFSCLFVCFFLSFVVPTHLVGPGEIIPMEGAQLVDTERAAYSVGATLAAK
jgi:hypothetical protein